MLNSLQRTRTHLLQAADGVLLGLALVLGYAVRAAPVWGALAPLEPLSAYLWLVPLIALLGPALLASQGLYEPRPAAPRASAVFDIVRGCMLTVAGLILFLFLVRLQLARSVVIFVGLIGGALVYLRHEITTRFAEKTFAQAQLRRAVLWVGSPVENARLRALLTSAERETLTDLGDFDAGQSSIEDFVRLLHASAANAVVLNLAGLDRASASSVMLACAREGVEVLVRPGLAALPSPRVTIDQFAGEAVFYYRAQTAARSHLMLKQAFDFAAAAALLLALAPLLALLAVVLKVSSPGPVLYRQRRAGLNGREFVMLKFRSMHLDAPAQQAALAGRNDMRGPVFKLRHDPRITRVGRLLRRFSADELPQLWNVLRGEMSLVGPRPLPVEEVRRFDNDTHRRRLSVKPGLTGLWQISGRSDLSDFTDWVRLDLAYIDTWSLWLDCKILAATIPVILTGRGAR